ncbi:Spy/CpxP family protein refolding chaperone [Acaryochloris sp. IP29b_bin.148]|uniref:Spy/CpxP family protein refolding chaperone n=1 Tax=Acaryochloris sp. IP29b_bin.148 TaxID=2969218 RepID=UPI002634AB5E|nr:Spy/CpxP family protein refolding chaperone [Acaryochloris sp. IP29b_bin.148]
MKFRPVYLFAALPLLLPVGSVLTAGAESLFPSYVVAQENSETEQPGKEEKRQQRREQFRQELNLTPEQTEQIDQIREQGSQAKEATREEFRAAREKMQTLMASDASDDELRAQHQVLQDLHQQMGDARFENKLQIRQVLTPEQRAKMAELKKQRQGKRGRGRRHHSQDSQVEQ